MVVNLPRKKSTSSGKDTKKTHEAVRVVSRDRSTDYSSAIASTGRKITEVADKFHLVKNITDHMPKLVAENYAEYRQAVRDEDLGEVQLGKPVVSQTETPPVQKEPDSRQIMFNEVKELQKKGFKPATIAKKLGIARQTSTKYCKMDSLPERNSKLRNGYYRFDAYVEQEAAKGKALSTIHQEICSMGFTGSLTPFYDHYKYLSDGHRGYRSRTWRPDMMKERTKDDISELMPVKAIASIIDKSMKGKEMDDSQEQTLRTLMSLGWFKEMYEAVDSFCKVINGNETTALVR